jgi:ferric-dicitrate binding protein FerR (iron transport regulator)
VKQNPKHINFESVDRHSKAFFSGGKFNWKRSNADVWLAIEVQIDNQPKSRSLSVSFSMSKWIAAASIAILIATSGYLRFHSVEVVVPAGQHTVAELPDHSKVDLNAQSRLEYYPYWWKVSRLVKLEGEGFFEVQKGKKFTVSSAKGITQVVGTSFNIYSRDNSYKVTCVTGSVKVRSRAGFEVLLKPNCKAEIQANGRINVIDNIETYSEISWKKNVFLFTALPVYQVFKEIERQYGIHIEASVDDKSLYTGNFTRDQNVEEVLEYVCPALGLKYIRKSAGEYLIVQKKDE